MHHLHVEVVRYPCEVADVISCVRTWTVSWGEKFAALEQVDSEYEDLVPCQNLAHAISTAEPKRNQSLILDKPKDRTMKKDNLGVQLHLPSCDRNLVGSKISGSLMCSGSFMMKERFDTKVEFAGKEYWPTVVGTVVEWKTETGATHEILCTSAMVAWVF